MADGRRIDDQGMLGGKLQNDESVIISKYRSLVRMYINLHQYNSAKFWADKVISLTENEEPEDVYWLAQCLFHMKKYHRAAHLIRSRGLEKKSVLCHYLAAKCLLEAKEPTEALQVLEENAPVSDDTTTNISTFDSSHDVDMPGLHNTTVASSMENSTHLNSSILFLKGRVYEAMDNRGLATDHYKLALHEDVHNYDAFEALIQHQMLTAWEEHDLLGSLPISKQCLPVEERLLRQLYESKLKKYDSPNSVANSNILEAHPGLGRNLELIVSQAERHYYNCNYRECIRITDQVLSKDPYHEGCLPVHIACLVELKKISKLFYLAHKLVDLFPEMALSWFAVGCYYYSINKSDPARRFLAKATSLDRLFGPAWIAYGHSFAAENEHDQAMAAYFKASQLMKGCHLPLLYIGLECGLGNNVKLADKFFLQAQTIAPDDPFVFHEMGVTAFQNLEYETAQRHFQAALARIRSIDNDTIAEKWEPLLNNLGHTCRKLGKFSEALEYHQQALLLSPLNPSTYSAIGYVHALAGQTAKAVDAFHKALGIRRDDTFSTTMLSYVIEQLMEEEPPFDGADDVVQSFSMPVASSSVAVMSTPRTRLFFDTTPEDSPDTTNPTSSIVDFEMQDTSPAALEESSLP